MSKPDPSFLARAEKALRQRGWASREAPKETRKLRFKDAHIWLKRLLDNVWCVTIVSLKNPNVALRIYVVECELTTALMRWISGRAMYPETPSRPPIDMWVTRRRGIPIVAWSRQALDAIDEPSAGKYRVKAYKSIRRQK